MSAIFTKLQNVTGISGVFTSTKSMSDDFARLTQGVEGVEKYYADKTQVANSLYNQFHNCYEDIKKKCGTQCSIPEVL